MNEILFRYERWKANVPDGESFDQFGMRGVGTDFGIVTCGAWDDHDKPKAVAFIVHIPTGFRVSRSVHLGDAVEALSHFHHWPGYEAMTSGQDDPVKVAEAMRECFKQLKMRGVL